MRVCGRDWLDSVVFVGNGEVSDCKCRRAFVFCSKCVIQVVLPLHLVLFVVVAVSYTHLTLPTNGCV